MFKLPPHRTHRSDMCHAWTLYDMPSPQRACCFTTKTLISSCSHGGARRSSCPTTPGNRQNEVTYDALPSCRVNMAAPHYHFLEWCRYTGYLQMVWKHVGVAVD